VVSLMCWYLYTILHVSISQKVGGNLYELLSLSPRKMKCRHITVQCEKIPLTVENHKIYVSKQWLGHRLQLTKYFYERSMSQLVTHVRWFLFSLLLGLAS